MNSLYLLTQLKLAVSNAMYCEATPEYRHLVVTYELERIEAICDELIKQRTEEEDFLIEGFPIQGENGMTKEEFCLFCEEPIDDNPDELGAFCQKCHEAAETSEERMTEVGSIGVIVDELVVQQIRKKLKR